MRILVMGSGGVGGYFGGRLAGAGNDVTFVARGAHLDAIRRDGLTLDSQLGNLTVKPAKAVARAEDAEAPEVVIFATKMGDAKAAAAQLRKAAAAGATIVTFQNGVEGADVVRGELPGAHVVSGVARIASHISRPGVIEQRSQFARLEFGEDRGDPSLRLVQFHAACKASGIDATLAPDIRRNLWIKFAMLAPFSGMTALTGHTTGPLRTNPATRALLEAAVKEVIAVGAAVGGHLRDDDFPRVMAALDGNPPGMTSSMAHDRRAGKPLEIAYLSGAVARIGAQHGVATPTHAFIAAALAIDAQGRQDATRG